MSSLVLVLYRRQASFCRTDNVEPMPLCRMAGANELRGLIIRLNPLRSPGATALLLKYAKLGIMHVDSNKAMRFAENSADLKLFISPLLHHSLLLPLTLVST